MNGYNIVSVADMIALLALTQKKIKPTEPVWFKKKF